MKLLKKIFTLVILMICFFAKAQIFPEKPIHMIVPFPPGGGSDALARILVKKLQDISGQPYIIENKGGAQGSVGTSIGSKANPDGYTITLIVQGTMAINPFIYGNVGYDVLKDFAPIIRATEQSYILVANPKLPVNSLKDIEDMAKKSPGKLTFATSGAGPQLVGELFKLTSKIDLLHVPYKGAGPAVLALLGGETDLMISNPTSVVQQIKSGRLKGIAVLGKERNEAIPDVQNAVEAGFKALSEIPEWYGFAAPTGTPTVIINKLNADFLKALMHPEVQKSIKDLGTNPSPSTPGEFSKQIAFDYDRWGKVVKAAGVKVE